MFFGGHTDREVIMPEQRSGRGEGAEQRNAPDDDCLRQAVIPLPLPGTGAVDDNLVPADCEMTVGDNGKLFLFFLSCFIVFVVVLLSSSFSSSWAACVYVHAFIFVCMYVCMYLQYAFACIRQYVFFNASLL